MKKPKPIRLRLGAIGVRRDRQKTGKIIENASIGFLTHPFIDEKTGCTYTESGRFWDDYEEDFWDIIRLLPSKPKAKRKGK